MQGQLSTLPPGGAGPALRLPLLHRYLLPFMRPRPGTVPAGACLKCVQEILSSWVSSAATGHPLTVPLCILWLFTWSGSHQRCSLGGEDKVTVDLLLGLHYYVTRWDVYLACLGVCPCVCVTSSKSKLRKRGKCPTPVSRMPSGLRRNKVIVPR